jgi:predicted homoserine dehydrogenase-like protein
MNLHRMLKARAAAGNPIRVGLIGAGKFGTMYVAQARTTPGVHLVAVADLQPERARESFRRTDWPDEQCRAASFDEARKRGSTFVTDDAAALIASDAVELVIEATGDPGVGIGHALEAFAHGKHVIMVTVEGDALAGPLLARRAAAAGVVYSLAYGDQPAIICELVDWARTSGFEVVCAGRGVKYLPHYHQSTPDTVWQYWLDNFTAEDAAAAGMNAKMFNSFNDGTKPATETCAVANACELSPQAVGLKFPPCGEDDLPHILRPLGDGGQLDHKGTVEVASSLERDGRPVYRDVRQGVLVTFEAPSDYAAHCFREYGLVTDDTGRYSALHRRVHLIGLELGISVASVALRGEPTGCARAFMADVVATAKRDLEAGEMLDGEGGYTVHGRMMPAGDSLAHGALPLGLAHGVTLNRRIATGETVGWADVTVDETDATIRFRREMEATFGAATKAAE